MIIIVMRPKATRKEVDIVTQKLVTAGLQYHLSKDESRIIIGVSGDKKSIAQYRSMLFRELNNQLT